MILVPVGDGFIGKRENPVLPSKTLNIKGAVLESLLRSHTKPQAVILSRTFF